MKFFIIPLCILFFGLTGCRKEDEVGETCFSDVLVDRIEQEEGEIKLIGSSWIVELTNSGERYLACNFPERLKIENLLFVFDADVYQIPPNMRLAGTPIIITHIYE